MAVNRVPVLKRCRSLGLDPIYLGIDKKSTRQLKRANRKMSEYGLQLSFSLNCMPYSLNFLFALLDSLLDFLSIPK